MSGRQGNLFSPLLFLIIIENLRGIMRSAAGKNLFRGYKIGKEHIEISYIFGKMKCALHIFELVSR